MGDNAHGTMVHLAGSILDAGSEDTGSTGDHGALNASLEGVDRMVATILTMGRHFRMVGGVMESSSGGSTTEMSKLVVVCAFPFPIPC